MKREILFRGKKLGIGEWVYGSSLVIATWDNPIENETNEKIYLIYAFDKTEIFPRYYGYSDLLSEERVIPETVGQFTGLTDKNGTKIFEGDIVKGLFNFGLPINAKVEFQDGSYGVTCKRCGAVGFTAFTCFYGLQWEVIGNIYDNPELMDKEEKKDAENQRGI